MQESAAESTASADFQAAKAQNCYIPLQKARPAFSHSISCATLCCGVYYRLQRILKSLKKKIEKDFGSSFYLMNM